MQQGVGERKKSGGRRCSVEEEEEEEERDRGWIGWKEIKWDREDNARESRE